MGCTYFYFWILYFFCNKKQPNIIFLYLPIILENAAVLKVYVFNIAEFPKSLQHHFFSKLDPFPKSLKHFS